MKIVSFFAGAGGLDLGFAKAGFDVIWANEKKLETYSLNDIYTNFTVVTNPKLFLNKGYANYRIQKQRV